MGCHFLLQGIFPNQGLNPCLLHWQADYLSLSHQGSPNLVAGIWRGGSLVGDDAFDLSSLHWLQIVSVRIAVLYLPFPFLVLGSSFEGLRCVHHMWGAQACPQLLWPMLPLTEMSSFLPGFIFYPYSWPKSSHVHLSLSSPSSLTFSLLLFHPPHLLWVPGASDSFWKTLR